MVRGRDHPQAPPLQQGGDPHGAGAGRGRKYVGDVLTDGEGRLSGGVAVQVDLEVGFVRPARAIAAEVDRYPQKRAPLRFGAEGLPSLERGLAPRAGEDQLDPAAKSSPLRHGARNREGIFEVDKNPLAGRRHRASGPGRAERVRAVVGQGNDGALAGREARGAREAERGRIVSGQLKMNGLFGAQPAAEQREQDAEEQPGSRCHVFFQTLDPVTSEEARWATSLPIVPAGCLRTHPLLEMNQNMESHLWSFPFRISQENVQE